MKKLLALAMLLVLCAVLTGLLTGCKGTMPYGERKALTASRRRP